jgi:thiol:disulfide interchange protein DsbC
MLQGEMPPRPMGTCDLAPLKRNLELAGRYHLNYTPAILFEDGSRFAGNADVDKLSKRLDEVAAARKG